MLQPTETLHQITDQEQVAVLDFPDGRRYGYKILTEDDGDPVFYPITSTDLDGLPD